MAAKRGRRPGFKMPEDHRTKIKHAMILKRLEGHIEGRWEMPASAVTAALGLMRKVLPDLAAVEHTDTTPIATRTIIIDTSGKAK